MTSGSWHCYASVSPSLKGVMASRCTLFVFNSKDIVNVKVCFTELTNGFCSIYLVCRCWKSLNHRIKRWTKPQKVLWPSPTGTESWKWGRSMSRVLPWVFALEGLVLGWCLSHMPPDHCPHVSQSIVSLDPLLDPISGSSHHSIPSLDPLNFQWEGRICKGHPFLDMISLLLDLSSEPALMPFPSLPPTVSVQGKRIPRYGAV